MFILVRVVLIFNNYEKIRAVKVIVTIFVNDFSKRANDNSMITAPW